MSTPERGLELDPKTWLDAKSADVMHPLESESKQGPDATTHAQVHRLPSEALLDTLKMILVGAPLNEVLTSVTRLIEANSEGMLCSILLLEKDDLHLRYAAAPNLPDSYRAATDRLAVGPSARSCGTAAYLRRPVFVADILTDPKWVKFRDLPWLPDCAPPGRAPSYLATARCWGPLACITGTSDTRTGRNAVDRLREPHCRNCH